MSSKQDHLNPETDTSSSGALRLRESVTWRALLIIAAFVVSLSAVRMIRDNFIVFAAPKAELSASFLSTGQVRLRWRLYDSSSIRSVLIYRSTSSKNNFELIRTILAQNSTYVDAELTPDTTYYYQIKIKNSSGLITDSSNIVSVTTTISSPDGEPTPTPTATPSPSPSTAPARLPGVYVAPNGSPGGDGTIERPLDLATALSSRSPARPGNTIWLRGGTYSGAFTSVLTGTAQAPIVVRQYPGERATLDGATSTNPTLTVNGAWAHFWGFEIANSNSNRSSERPSGLMIYGPNTKFINLILHDAGSGVGFWTAAIDSEVYGSIIYNNGWQGPAPDRGHGHGIYSQNAEGTKRIVDNIIFDQYGYGIHNYAQAGDLKGFHIEGNTVFCNGSMATPADTDEPNILVGGVKPSERVKLIANYTYHPLQRVATNVALNYSAKNNKDVLVQDNYFAGGTPFSASEWQQLIGGANTFIGARDLFTLVVPEGLTTSVYSWDRNTYYTNNSTNASPLILHSNAKTGSFSFAEWQQVTGLDRNSQLLRSASAKPSGVKVFVRPNIYEAGRANITVYNWDGNSAVDVNIGNILAPGARYEIRSVYNYFGQPAVSGTYNGQPIRLPMTGTKTGPEFNAFVLTPAGSLAPSASPTPSPAPKPSPSPAPTPTPTPTPSPTPTNPNNNSSTASTPITLDAEEQKLLELVNAYRLQQGRNPLNPSISLSQASEWLADDMALRNYVNKTDSLGRTPSQRSRAFGFPGSLAPIEENALVAAGNLSARQVFDLWHASTADKDLLLNKQWKNAGAARSYDSAANRWVWNLTLGAYWDKSIPLAGEDAEGMIDRNELVRTRPPAGSLIPNRTFTGYGDDGQAYNPVHCVVNSSPTVCWHDPPPQGNPRLDELSRPENLIGVWQVKHSISPYGVVHANLDPWDHTGFIMEFQINANGTWTMKGYRKFQTPVVSESGTWKSTHNDAQNEETVIFIRENNLPRTSIRIHAASGQLTFFASHGGSFMKNFLRGVVADSDRSDDPQIIFVEK